MTTTWMMSETMNVSGFLPVPLRRCDSLSWLSNMLLHRSGGRRLGRLLGGLLLVQLDRLVPVFVRLRDVLGRLLRVGALIDPRLLAVEQVDERERFDVVGVDCERLVLRVDPLGDHLLPLLVVQVGIVV